MSKTAGDLSTKKPHFMEVTWKIRNFFRIPAEVDSTVNSPSFTLANAVWQLVMYSNGRTCDDTVGYIDFYLKRLNSSISEQKVRAKFCLTTVLGEEWDKHSITHLFHEKDRTCGVMNFAQREKIKKDKSFLFSNGALTVQCQIIVELSRDEALGTASPLEQFETLAFPCKQHDAHSQTEMLDISKRTEDVPGTTSSIVPDFFEMAQTIGDLSIEPLHHLLDVTWKIRDFFRIPAEVDSPVCSPSFTLAKSVWQLEMYPNGSTCDDSEGYVDFGLKRLNSSISEQRVTAKFRLITKQGKEWDKYILTRLFDEKVSFLGVINFAEREEINKNKSFLLSNGTLTAQCQIRVKLSRDVTLGTTPPLEQLETLAVPRKQHDAHSRTKTLDTSKRTEDVPGTTSTVHKLQSDYKKLLESEEEADVCLKVSDKEFRAHKCILRARSAVFSAMFKHDTEERASGEVVIEDLNPESFPDFLQHMYTGSLDTLSEENVFNLYTAADKYGMMDLKSEYKNYMERTLSVDTFCNVMIWALRYKEDELLKLAIDFFCKNLKKIIVTVKWQMFSKEYNTEANELFIKALVSDDEK